MTKKHKQLDDNYNITSKSSVYAKEVWNAAIEKAAQCAEINKDDCEIHRLIRKLKV